MKKVFTTVVAVLLLISGQTVTAAGTNLVDTVKDRDYEAARALLYSAVDVNEQQADGTTALHWAVLRDDLEIARLLIDSGADTNLVNDYGVGPLYLACTNRNNEMVGLLLRGGADPNAALWTGETVLMNCAHTGATDAVRTLLESAAEVNLAEKNNGQTALMWAVAGGHSSITRLLIEHGADITRTTISTSTTLPHTCRVCPWIPSSGGFTPLLFAARSGDLESARYLLEAGADPNEATDEHGNSLVIASAGGHEDLVLYLLEEGADPNSSDETGITALHHAVGAGLSVLNGVIYDKVYRIQPVNSQKLVRALIDAGADINARIGELHLIGPDGYPFSMVGATPFLLAAASADVEMMKLLLNTGADLTITNVEGITPLIAAAQFACTGTCAYQEGGNVGNSEGIAKALVAVKALVEMGTDLNETDEDGNTAMHLAAFTGSDSVIQYLADMGAPVDVQNKTGETPWTMASGINPGRDSGQYGVHKNTAELLVRLGADPVVHFERYYQ